MSKVYMAVTKDKYSLPYAIAFTPQRLAEICGISVETVYSGIRADRKKIAKKQTYICVELDDGKENGE